MQLSKNFSPNISSSVYLRIAFSILLFLATLEQGIVHGGSWDLATQIFTADKIHDGLSLAYTHNQNQLNQPYSGYFYLQPLLLSLLLNFFSLEKLDIISCLIIGPISVVILYNLICTVASKMGNIKKIDKNILLWSGTTIYSLSWYLGYASRLKPDTLGLIFLCLIILAWNRFIEDINELNLKKLSYISTIAILIFLACSTKQQLLLPCLVFSIYSGYSVKNAKLSVLFIFSSLLAILLPMIIFDHYIYYTVASYIDDGIGPILKITSDSISTFIQVIFINFLILSLSNFSVIIKTSRLIGNEISLYLPAIGKFNKKFNKDRGMMKGYSAPIYRNSTVIVFTSWFIAQISSAYKNGGNMGNFEVGILPIICIFIPLFFYVKSPNIVKQDESYLKRIRINSVLLANFLTTLLIISHFNYANYIYTSGKSFITKDITLVNHLRKNTLVTKPILVDWESSLIARKAGYKELISSYQFTDPSIKESEVIIDYINKNGLSYAIRSNDKAESYIQTLRSLYTSELKITRSCVDISSEKYRLCVGTINKAD